MLLLFLGCPSPPNDAVPAGDSNGGLDSAPVAAGALVAEHRAYDLTVEDLDGDGHRDVLAGFHGIDGALGDEGGLGVWLGPVLEGETRSLDATLVGPVAGSALGSRVAVADLDGDGTSELLVGASGHTDTSVDQGAVYVIEPSALLSGELGTPHVLKGPESSHLGFSLVVEDFDGDGLAEIAAGAPYAGREGRPGTGLVVLLGEERSQSLEDHTVLQGDFDHGELGFAVGAGDFDGDGQADLAVGAANHGDDGAALVLLGPLEGALSPDDALRLDADRDAADFLRGVVSGDVDGDGVDDLFVTVGPEFEGSDQPATTWLIAGPLDAGSLPEVAVASFTDSAVELLQTQGQHALSEDLDGDGFSDLVVGNTEVHSVDGASAAGRVRVWYGPLSGAAGEPALEVRGDTESQALGRALAFDEGLLLISAWGDAESHVLVQSMGAR